MKPSIYTAVEASRIAFEELTSPRRAQVYSAEDAQNIEDSGRLLEDAKALLDQAQRHCAQLEEEAKERGRKQGLAQASEALVKARQEHLALLRDSESEMVQLALELTRTIVGRQLEMDPSLLGELVAHAMVLARGHHKIRVLTNPEDIERLDPDRLEMQAEAPIAIVPSEEVPKGGCMIQTKTGIIEADLDTQIEVLADLMGVNLWAGGRSDG